MGRGGFGMIYLAYDEQSDKTVAVKEFFPDGTAVRSQDNITAEPMTTIQQENYGEGLERFFREAEIISGFPECSELIGIYDVFRENGTAYYAMEFVHGASLKSYAETSSAISSAPGGLHSAEAAAVAPDTAPARSYPPRRFAGQHNAVRGRLR